MDAGLLVHSVPAGALVSVDGTPRGTTPVAIRGLRLGTHTVSVSRPGYRDAERHLELTSERPSRTLEVELRPATGPIRASSAVAPTAGALVIDSRPTGTAVFVDGRPVGVTPLRLDVPTGSHSVRLERAGYRTVTTTVEVAAGERTRVAVRLEGGQDDQ
jgi:hypothetical protein